MKANHFKAIKWNVTRDFVALQFNPWPYGLGHEDFMLLWSPHGGFKSTGEIAYQLRQLHSNLTVKQSETLATKIQTAHGQFTAGYPVT